MSTQQRGFSSQNNECLEKIDSLVQNNSRAPCTFLEIDDKPTFNVVPSSLLQLTSLAQLVLTNNNLTSLGKFNDFSALKGLKKLDLSGNSLRGAFPDDVGGNLGNAKSIKELNLSRNKLSSIGAIGNLLALEKLDISSNLIQKVGSQINRLVRLQKFNLRDNQLDHVPKLPGRSLKKLDISSNIVTSIPAFCGSWEKINKFDVSRNCVTSIPASLARLKDVDKLDLRHNPLTSIPEPVLDAQTKNIQRLRHSVPCPIVGVPGLYLGSLCGANNTAALDALGISHILTIAGPDIDVERDHRIKKNQKDIKRIQMLAREKGTPEPIRNGLVFKPHEKVLFILDGDWLPAIVHLINARKGQAFELKYTDPKNNQTMYRLIKRTDARNEIRKLVDPEEEPRERAPYIYHKIQLLDLPEVDIASRFNEAFDFINKGLPRKTSTTSSSSIAPTTSSATTTATSGVAAGGAATSVTTTNTTTTESKINGNPTTTDGGGTGVLVHCRVGVSRSATVCIAYLLNRYGIPVEEGIQTLRSTRPVVQPNEGFLKQLAKYEEQLKAAAKSKGDGMKVGGGERVDVSTDPIMSSSSSSPAPSSNTIKAGQKT